MSGMIMQLTNIAAGIILASGKRVVPEPGTKKKFGYVVLVLGVLSLLDRIGLWIPIPAFGSSYPQSLAAVILGLLLIEKWDVKPYEILVGFIGFFVGFYSLHLFGI